MQILLSIGSHAWIVISCMWSLAVESQEKPELESKLSFHESSSAISLLSAQHSIQQMELQHNKLDIEKDDDKLAVCCLQAELTVHKWKRKTMLSLSIERVKYMVDKLNICCIRLQVREVRYGGNQCS